VTELKNEFSWSKTRDEVFKTCPGLTFTKEELLEIVKLGNSESKRKKGGDRHSEKD